MKVYSKCLLILAASLSCFFGHSQENKLLKEFINENDIAVRSVQKYSINLTDPANEVSFKDILKLQSASVKLFTSNPGKSADVAFVVRQKCSDFLKTHSKGSLEYLILSDKESKFFSSPKPIAETSTYLNQAELEKIDTVNTKDPQLFDNLNTRIN